MMRLSYDANSRSPQVDDGKTLRVTNDISVNALQAGATYWATKHIRVTAEYSLYMFPGDPPAAGATTSNQAAAPGARATPPDPSANLLHEMSVRWASRSERRSSIVDSIQRMIIPRRRSEMFAGDPFPLKRHADADVHHLIVGTYEAALDEGHPLARQRHATAIRVDLELVLGPVVRDGLPGSHRRTGASLGVVLLHETDASGFCVDDEVALAGKPDVDDLRVCGRSVDAQRERQRTRRVPNQSAAQGSATVLGFRSRRRADCA
jgi:hypothetical protein